MGFEDSGLLRPYRSQPKWTSAGFELWTSSLRRNNGTQEATGPHESRLALDQGKHHTPFYTVSWNPIVLGLSFLIKYGSLMQWPYYHGSDWFAWEIQWNGENGVLIKNIRYFMITFQEIFKHNIGFSMEPFFHYVMVKGWAGGMTLCCKTLILCNI